MVTRHGRWPVATLPVLAASLCALSLASAQVAGGVQQSLPVLLPLIEKSAYDGIPCGKVFRVATHLAPPFIKVDTQKCSAQKCPPEAFGSDGGLTYEFVMNEVRDGLIQICKDRGDTPRVDFEWYLPATDRTNPRSALEMVCQGSFSPGQAAAESQAALVNRCKSGTPAGYKGPSPIGTCRQIGDQSCLSSGPDFAAGALHITPDALQMLSMTAPYYNFKQLTVKRPAEQPDLVTELTKVYAAFSNELWLCIMGEVLLVWLLFLATEPYNDDCLEGGWTLYFDCFYWSFTTLLCGVDKDAVTVGGKIVFTGHLFFCFILCATYTGAVAAFLTQAAAPSGIRFDYIHTHTHTHTHTQRERERERETYSHSHTHTHACMYACMYVCMHVCMYACMHACMHACMYVCMYACMYVCMHFAT